MWTYITVGVGIVTSLIALITTIIMCIKAKRTFKETDAVFKKKHIGKKP